jgi:hypothetical protein
MSNPVQWEVASGWEGEVSEWTAQTHCRATVEDAIEAFVSSDRDEWVESYIPGHCVFARREGSGDEWVEYFVRGKIEWSVERATEVARG